MKLTNCGTETTPWLGLAEPVTPNDEPTTLWRWIMSELNLFGLSVGIGIALIRIKEAMSVATSDEIRQILSVAEKEAAACLKAVISEIDRMNP